MGQPEQNPKGHFNVVTTHNGKQIGSSNEREINVEESVPTPLEKKVVEEVDKETVAMKLWPWHLIVVS